MTRPVLLSQVAVGKNTVWAISKDHSVWFRQGVRDGFPIGSSWIEISEFRADCLSVTRNNELFAIGTVDQHIYWRSEITLEDPHGKRWRRVALKIEGGHCEMKKSRVGFLFLFL